MDGYLTNIKRNSKRMSKLMKLVNHVFIREIKRSYLKSALVGWKHNAVLNLRSIIHLGFRSLQGPQYPTKSTMQKRSHWFPVTIQPLFQQSMFYTFQIRKQPLMILPGGQCPKYRNIEYLKPWNTFNSNNISRQITWNLPISNHGTFFLILNNGIAW